MFTFTVRETVTIDRPVAEVFDFIADSRNDVEWCPSVKEIRRISANGKGVGARYRMHHSPGGMNFDATVEVVACERPHLLQWVMTDRGHTLHGTYQLEPSGSGTRLTQTSQITLEGWLRVPGLFLKSSIKKDVQKELGTQFQNLKRLLESEPSVSRARPQGRAA